MSNNYNSHWHGSASRAMQTEVPCSKKVFELRKIRKLDEALVLARDCYNKNKEDEWSAKALGWVLYDLIKNAINANKYDKGKEYLEELVKLNINDELIIKKTNELQFQLIPEGKILQKAKEASKAGNNPEALKFYREAIVLLPNNVEANEGLGWCLARAINTLAKEKNSDFVIIRNYLKEYYRLNIKKPSKLHSWILDNVTKVSEFFPTYIEFVKWWDINNFTLEDYAMQKSGQNIYKSQAQKVAYAISDIVTKRNLIDEVDFAIDIIDKAISSCQDSNSDISILNSMGKYYSTIKLQDLGNGIITWLKYKKGKLLILAERYDEARNYIIPIVRQKQKEWWAWNVLGHSYLKQDIEKSIACLCKAISLCAQEESLLKVKVELAELFEKVENFQSAKYELDYALKARKEKGFKIDRSLIDFTQKEWYENTELIKSNDDTYAKYIPMAEDIYSDTLPWIDALLTSRTKLGDCFIGIVNDTNVKELLIKKSSFPDIVSLELGQPLLIKVDLAIANPTILKAKPREEEKWDILPYTYGIIEHHNTEKGVSNIVVGYQLSCLAYHDKFDTLESLDVGDLVIIKGFKFTDKTDNNIKFKLCQIEKSYNRSIESSFIKTYKGEVRIKEGQEYGFIGDYYLHPELVKSYQIKNGYEIYCLLVLSLSTTYKRRSFDQQKEKINDWKWKVIKIFDVLSRIYKPSKDFKNEYYFNEDYYLEDDQSEAEHYLEIYNNSYRELYGDIEKYESPQK